MQISVQDDRIGGNFEYSRMGGAFSDKSHVRENVV